MAGSRAPEALTRAELVRSFAPPAASPVERDTLYNVVAEGAALDAVLSVRQRKSLEVLA